MGTNDRAPLELTVEMAGRKFVVERVPMAKVRQFGSMVSRLVQQIDFAQVGEELQGDPSKAAEVFQRVVDELLAVPYEVLSVFIKGLPEDIFLDEDKGVTVPEFLDAFYAALAVNRLDALKNFYSRLR